jgi:hypothetical protein
MIKIDIFIFTILSKERNTLSFKKLKRGIVRREGSEEIVRKKRDKFFEICLHYFSIYNLFI